MRTRHPGIVSCSCCALRLVPMVMAAVLFMTSSISIGWAAPLMTVRYLAAQGALGDWSPYVAADRGYFKDEGIDFQLKLLSQADIATALISGRGDIGIASLPLVITAALTGAPIKMISATQMATPSGHYNNWWATLPNSSINEPADLRGKKVDIYSQNSLAQAVTRDVLAKAGVKAGEYQEVSIPFPQTYSALQGGLVNVGFFIEPFFSLGNRLSIKKYGKPLKVVYTYLTDFTKGIDRSAMLANTNFVAKNPNAVRAFLRATTRAAKWGNAHPVELRKIIAKYAGAPYKKIMNMIPSQMSEDGRPLPGVFDRLQALMIKYKMIPNFTSPLKPSAFLDLSYLPSAR